MNLVSHPRIHQFRIMQTTHSDSIWPNILFLLKRQQQQQHNYYFKTKIKNNYFFPQLCCAACGVLVPQPGIKPVTPAVEA